MRNDFLLISRQYWSAIRQYKLDIALLCGLPISALLSGVAIPYIASLIIAHLPINGYDMRRLLVAFVVCVAFSLTLNMVGIRALMRMSALAIHNLHESMFHKLMTRSVGFFNNNISGKLVADASAYEDSFTIMINTLLLTLMNFFLVMLAGLVVIFIGSALLGVIISAFLIALTIMSVIWLKRRNDLRSERIRLKNKVVGHMADSLVNAVTIKTFAGEQREQRAASRLSKKLTEVRIQDWLQGNTNENYRMGVLMVSQVALVFWLVGSARTNVNLLATGVFAFTYTVGLLSRFFTINTAIRQLSDTIVQVAPMARLLKETPEILDSPDANELRVTGGSIEFTDISFEYTDMKQGTEVFDKLNLQITSGEKIGLVGHSGGGKSTLTRLLLRFDDLQSGTILIDGQNIAGVKQTSLRNAVGYIPQEPLLFHRSIKENIEYGRPGASLDEVRRAAQTAEADVFISQLPHGYDTVVGERGVKLSGGQRQRVAIARAILKNAPILVLDEATSALDSESEKAIQAALWKLMENKTALVIAHRLSTIREMDRILVLDDGKIVEEGSHDELLKQKGLYARLWKHQSGGFIQE